jgi:hypothetical protein
VTLSADAATEPFVAALAKRLHGTAARPCVLPFRNGTRVRVEPLSVVHTGSRFRSARVSLSPDHPPTGAWTDYDAADQATCVADARALQGAQLAQYQRRASAATPAAETALLTNPRFPTVELSHTQGSALRRTCFDQLDFTCGDWSDLWYHAMYGSYTRMRAPAAAGNAALRPRVRAAMATLRPRYFGPGTPYVGLSPATTCATLTYAFQHLQKGVYVRIRDGALDAFLPFCRHNYTNTVYDQYYLPGSPDDRAELREMRALEADLRAFDQRHRDPDSATAADKARYTEQLARLLELETVCARRYARAHRGRGPTDLKANPNRRQWLPNNHFVNQAVYLDNPNVHHFRYLLRTLVAHRALPDAEFVLNLRDHPVLRAHHDAATDTTTVVNPYPDLERTATAATAPTTLAHVPGGMAPILSHTGKDGHADIPLPTVDDIQHYSQRVFLDQCGTNYLDPHTPFTPSRQRPDALWVDWADKTVAKAVFRGSGTGRGTTPDVNERLAVWRLAHTPAGRAVLDVELTSLNAKPKVVAGDDGLAFVQPAKVQAACGSKVQRTKHYLDLAARSAYKYVLCLDGQTRADRMLNEMRTGSLLVLPTPPLPHGGHRLWLEAFLTPLHWERDLRDAPPGAWTEARARSGGFTHVTLDDVTEVDALVRWLLAHDAVAAQVVANVKTTLFDPVHGLGARRPPATCFLYDYMEAIVRLIASRHAHSPRRPYTLLPATPPRSVASTHVVGIVVGFRDTVVGGGVRTAQLDAFRSYFATLFPSTWRHDLVVATQAVVAADRTAFDRWWDATFGQDRAQATVDELRAALHQARQTRRMLPPCLARNLGLVGDDIDLALGVPSHGPKRGQALRRVWTRDEAYRRVGEEKFNLGQCKNRGYRTLKDRHGPRLSHVIFTDIDILPDHALAPHYARVPGPHEVIALAHRGTVYETVSADDLPTRNLEAAADAGDRDRRHPSTRRRPHRTQHRGRRGRGGGVQSRGARRRPRPSSQRVSRGLRQRAQDLARQWTRRKFQRFLGAALSIRPALFEAANGYPNTFWGWGGEDDALVARLGHLDPPVTYTVPDAGRLIDLEMAQPVTLEDKLGARVKEQQKRERLRADVREWRGDGVAGVAQGG